MAGHSLTVERLAELTEVARGWGRIVADLAYGDDGPGFDVDLAGMEEIAWLVSQALNQGACETLTARQAARLPEEQPCPTCGRGCAVRQPTGDDPKEARTMRVRGGPFELREPRCFCDRCGRSFFPAADGVADRRQGVQPDRDVEAAEDGR